MQLTGGETPSAATTGVTDSDMEVGSTPTRRVGAREGGSEALAELAEAFFGHKDGGCRALALSGSSINSSRRSREDEGGLLRSCRPVRDEKAPAQDDVVAMDREYASISQK